LIELIKSRGTASRFAFEYQNINLQGKIFDTFLTVTLNKQGTLCKRCCKFAGYKNMGV